jgi:hypothetical protein
MRKFESSPPQPASHSTVDCWLVNPINACQLGLFANWLCVSILPNLNNLRAKLQIVSGLHLKYSRFLETTTRDRVRSALRGVGRSRTQPFLKKRKPKSPTSGTAECPFGGKSEMPRTSRDVAQTCKDIANFEIDGRVLPDHIAKVPYCGNRIRFTSSAKRGSQRSFFQRGSRRSQTSQCDLSSKASLRRAKAASF